MKSQENKKKVSVGLSGGVDSSVSAALLKKDGYDVTGVFIKVWNSDHPFLFPSLEKEGTQSYSFPTPSLQGGVWGGCLAAEDRLDAMRVCAKLNIPFRELNLEKEYKKEVVDYMIREYKAGRTPNPDVFCNRFIKFGAFYEWAMKNGADFVATGHYAQIMDHGTWNMEQKRKAQSNASCFMLRAAFDSAKDQSYFLWQIRREQLPHILFPVGGMLKLEVRKLAKKFGLITAEKKDSQGLCFIGKVDMKEFLSRYIKPKKGKVLNEQGEIIGTHEGAFFFTLGERHSFRITNKKKEEKPYYVVAKDIKKNTITVSHKFENGVLSHAVKEVVIKHCNWISGIPPSSGKAYGARMRYRAPLQKCRIRKGKERGLLTLTFDESQSAVTPGQSAVVYDENACLGGGIIF